MNEKTYRGLLIPTERTNLLGRTFEVVIIVLSLGLAAFCASAVLTGLR